MGRVLILFYSEARPTYLDFLEPMIAGSDCIKYSSPKAD